MKISVGPLLFWNPHSYGRSARIESLRGSKHSGLPSVAAITLRSCQPIPALERWRRFCPEDGCSGPLLAQPLLPGFHLLSCYCLVPRCFVSLCSIADMNIIKALFRVWVIKGLIFRFRHTATPQREAPRRCALLPRGRASVSLHTNTRTANTSCPKSSILLPVLPAGWDDVGSALC